MSNNQGQARYVDMSLPPAQRRRKRNQRGRGKGTRKLMTHGKDRDRMTGERWQEGS